VQGLGDDLLGRLHLPGRCLGAGDVEELGGGHARADGHDTDAGRAGLGPERLGEGQQVCLGGGVGGEVGDGLEGRGGGNVDDDAVASIQHAGEHGVGEVRGGADVEGEHLLEPPRVRVGEGCVG